MVDESVVGISEYANALKRWWPLIAACAAAGLLLGVAMLSLQNRSFVSQARVEVRPLVIQGDDPNLDVSRQVDTDTERVIAGSQRVAERALALIAAADGFDDLDSVEVELEAAELIDGIDDELARSTMEQVEVTSPADTKILVFTASADSAVRAQEIAQATAHAYLDFRSEEGLASTELARSQLTEREAELIADLDALSAAIAAASSDAQRQSLAYQDVSKREELAGIGARLANISAISVNPGEVLDDASLPESRSGIPRAAGPLGGVLLGGMAGLALAFVLDRKDDRFRSAPAELVEMGLAPMGVVPIGGGRFGLGSGPAIAEVNSEPGEAYRRVQGSLLFNLDRGDKSVVLVSGTNNPQTTTTVAANVAASAARAGRRTLLVGADLRRPSLHARFGLGNDAGLSDVLAGDIAFDQAVQGLPELPNLTILSAGSPIEQPARVLQSDALGRLVNHVRDEFDLVVFEAPPVLQVADAVDLARLCEGAVLVVEPGRADRTAVADSVEQLRRVGATVIGTIVAEGSPA